MDKLLNISRDGGYPMCAETLQVLYDNARAVNVLLAGLNLPNNTAVLLGAENFATAATGYRYMYAVNNYNRRLIRYTRASGVDLSSAKVTITEVAHDVTNSNEQTISGVYSYERAVIESTNDATEKWTFYNLKDVLEPAIYKDLLPELRAQLANTIVSLDENYGNILCKNDRKLRVKLKLDVNTQSEQQALNATLYTVDISLPVTIQGVFLLNMSMKFHDVNYSVKSILEGSTLKVYVGEVLSNLASSGTTWFHESWTMYINTEILL